MRRGILNSLKEWYAYFTQNSFKRGSLAYEVEDVLTAEEKRSIAKSIAAFQLGEYSEGKGLLKAAERFAEKIDNPYLVPITRLFIAEEQNHALLLRDFMVRHEIKLIKKNWTDAVFRRLRKNVGYEVSITVLITAEIISLVYYRALRQCTNSPLLQRICDKILSDEKAHVTYESAMLNFIRQKKSEASLSLIGFLHRFLFFGTVLVVYLSHRKVIRKGGYKFTHFWKACWAAFANCFAANVVQSSSAV
jgi:hypothetical protein